MEHAAPTPPIASARAFEQEVRKGVDTWVRAAFAAAARQLGGAALTNAVAADRMHTAEVLALLQGRGEAVAAAMVRAVHDLMDDPARGAVERERAPTAATVPGVPLTLSLIAEDQIDEDIAIARIIQSIESEAEWELRQLTSLCSGLTQRKIVDAEANPLGPALCARALKRSLEGFGLGHPAQLMLLRHAGTAMGTQLRSVYAALGDLLKRSGVKPAQFLVRQSVAPGVRAESGVPSPAAAHGPAAAARRRSSKGGARGISSEQLERLLERARRVAEKAAALDRAVAAEPTLRLLDEPVALGSVPSTSLDPRSAVRVMESLLEQLARQTTLPESARVLLRKLEQPARRIAAAEPELWNGTDHPWWQLLDRILALGAVYDPTTTTALQGAPSTSLADVVDQLGATANVSRQACEQALEAAEFVATGLLEDRKERLVTEVGAIQAQADRAELEIGLRNQLVEQMRSSPAAPALRQFLLGPWTLAMAELAHQQGVASPALSELGQLVEDLLRACSTPGRAVSTAQQRVLLNKARSGLASAGLTHERVEAERADLAKLLGSPPPVEAAADADADLPAAEAVAPSTDLMGHAGLPTVPIDMVESTQLTDAMRDRVQWLDGLEAGDACRMFLQGRWATAQLTWISGNRNLFVFTSRHAGRTHSMTRRVLERLRAAGLAATIEPGLLIAQAMDTMLGDAEGA